MIVGIPKEIKNNEKKTGVSVFYVDKGIDSGPIIVQKEIDLNGQSHFELIKQSKKLGMDAVLEAVSLIYKNKVKMLKNDSNLKTYYGFPKRADILEFRKNNKFF